VLLRGDLGRPSPKARFAQMFSNSRAVNVLAAARVFLFASRDVWFVIGVPVFMRTQLGWSFRQVGAFPAGRGVGFGPVGGSRLTGGMGSGAGRVPEAPAGV